RQIARADRLAGRQIAVDDLAKDLARALVERNEARLARADWDVLCHKGPLIQEDRPSELSICGEKFKRRGSGSQFRPRNGIYFARKCDPGRPLPPRNEVETSMRPSRRQPDELRAVTLERGVVKYAEGCCFVKFGDTHVRVTATLEDRLPPWLKGQARGWITAEYGMLPRATLERTRREASAGKQGGRTIEIQRLIGRSLRAVVDLAALGE